MSDLSELFARDPLLLTDQDLDRIVARMREAQAQHELGVKPPPKAAAAKKPSKAAIDLKELGL